MFKNNKSFIWLYFSGHAVCEKLWLIEACHCRMHVDLETKTKLNK